MKLTSYLYLEARFRMHASIPPLPHMSSWHGADLRGGIRYLSMAQTYVSSLNCVVLPSSFKRSGGSVSHSCGYTLCADVSEIFFQRSNDVRSWAAFQLGLSQQNVTVARLPQEWIGPTKMEVGMWTWGEPGIWVGGTHIPRTLTNEWRSALVVRRLCQGFCDGDLYWGTRKMRFLRGMQNAL